MAAIAALRPTLDLRPLLSHPRWLWPPDDLSLNRISSLGRGRPDQFRLDQHRCLVLFGRRCTAVNCNPDCNRGLSAWEASFVIRGLRAQTLICGMLARLATSDRESPLGLTPSGT